MGEAFKSILHNPICLLILGVGGFWLAINVIKKIYKKFLMNSKKLKKLGKGIKDFFMPNKGVRSFRDFKHHLPYRLRRKFVSVQHYLHLNLSETDSLLKQTKYDYFHNQFYPSYQPSETERYILDDKSFVYEVNQETSEALSEGMIRRHWKKVFKKGMPNIIVSLDLDQIGDEAAAQFVRKQVDILQKLKRRQLPLFIQITGLNKANDGQGLVDYLKEAGDAIYAMPHQDSQSGLIEIFKGKLYQTHTRILSSMGKLNQGLHAILGVDLLLEKVKSFESLISLLEYENQVLMTPRVSGIFLERYSDSSQGVMALTRSKKRYYMSGHRMMGAAITLICLGILSAAFWKTDQLLGDAQNGVKLLGSELQSAQVTDHAFSNGVNSIANGFQVSLKESVLPRFYPAEIITKSLHRTIANEIFQQQIMPLLQNSQNPYQIAYLLMIVHANHIPGMRDFVKRYEQVFSAVSGLSVYDLNQFLMYDKANHKVRLTGSAVESIPMTNVQTLYDNFKSQLASLANSHHVTLQEVKTFYNGAYYQYAGQILLQVSLMKYYDGLKPLLSKDEGSFFSHLITMQGQENSLSLVQKHLKLVENVEAPPSFKIPDVNSFGALVGLIDQVLNKQPSGTQEKVFAWATGAITKAKWHDMMVRAEINSLMADYIHHNQLSFGTHAVQESTAVLPEAKSNEVSASESYSASYVQEIVLADIQAYQKLLKGLNKKGIPAGKLEEIYQSAINRYVKNYVSYYRKQISDFSYYANSVAELEVLIEQMTSDDSPLEDLVTEVNQNTQFSSKLVDKHAFLQSINDAFAGFHQLGSHVKVSEKAAGVGSETYLQAYMNILMTIESQLNTAAQDGTAGSVEKVLGDQATSIYLNDSGSFMKSANQLMDKANIPVSEREPFINIFALIFKFGLPQVEQNIQNEWNQSVAPIANKVLDAFPFSLGSKHEIEPQELTVILAPKTGRFWTKFDATMAQFFVKKSGQWQMRSIPYVRSIKVGDVLEQLNGIEGISERLWHASGQPKPLIIKSSALPFINQKVAGKYIQMTYFSLDGQSVMGLNNHPVVNSIPYKWWQKGNASIGYFLENGKNHEVSKDGYWAIYQLIKQATYKNGGYIWNVGAQPNHVAIAFSFPELGLPRLKGVWGL